jgi:hypothetical protein
VSDNQYGGATTESASARRENLLVAQGAGGGRQRRVLSQRVDHLRHAARAREGRLAGKVKLVGFDASDKLVARSKDGKIDGLVLQNPFNMGYLAVKTMVRHLRGEKVEPASTPGRAWSQGEHGQPEMKELLEPDLEEGLPSGPVSGAERHARAAAASRAAWRSRSAPRARCATSTFASRRARSTRCRRERRGQEHAAEHAGGRAPRRRGVIELDGRALRAALARRRARDAGIAIVHQELSLCPT